MLQSLVARVRSLWQGVRRTDDLDADLADEFQLHIELRAQDLEKSGVAPDEAMRRARAEFGGTWNIQQQTRQSRGLHWFDALRFSWLDFRLGMRMLRKYPWLTVISSLAMGVAIAAAAGGSSALSMITNARLPLHEGDRVIGIQLYDVESRRPERRILQDAADWRQLRTLQDVGTFRGTLRNIADDRGNGDVVRAVEMNASGFRVARVAPLLGRYLTEDDERPGAPRVIVIGYPVWRTLGLDSAAIGHTMKFGNVDHTIVGVMPEGFRFPVAYDAWVPPTLRPLDYQRREGPALHAIGRLAPGATIDDARAELAAMNARVAQASPRTHRTLEARLRPFTQSWFELDSPETILGLTVARGIMAFLLLVICTNVAVLVFARTATRQSEVAVRTALGASRSRIVAQLFGEALVLSALGAAVGLGILFAISTYADAILAGLKRNSLPFWMRMEVSGTTLWYLVLAAAISAVIIGVIPALRVTGSRVQLSLQRLASGNSSVRMGRMWTSIIILEVALTVAILPATARFLTAWAELTVVGPGFPAAEYLAATLSLERQTGMDGLYREGEPVPVERSLSVARFARARARLAERLAANPEVERFTFAGAIPGAEGPRRVEVESLTVVDSRLANNHAGVDKRLLHPLAREAVVDPGFFDTFGVELVAGRTFVTADTNAAVLVVNRSFVDSLVGGRSAVGRRVRSVSYQREQVVYGPWKEIIGVVEDFPVRPLFDRTRAAVYEPGSSAGLYPAMAIVHTRGDPAAFGLKLRALANDVDRQLLLRDVATMDALVREANGPLMLVVIGLAAVAFSVLVLSAAGLYALMSVIVTQRRREIGIRIALGASQRRVLSTIFSRVAAQVGIGIAVGLGLASIVNVFADGEVLGGRSVLFLAGVAVFMGLVGMIAGLQPARRGLRIQPTEALKAE